MRHLHVKDFYQPFLLMWRENKMREGCILHALVLKTEHSFSVVLIAKFGHSEEPLDCGFGVHKRTIPPASLHCGLLELKKSFLQHRELKSFSPWDSIILCLCSHTIVLFRYISRGTVKQVVLIFYQLQSSRTLGEQGKSFNRCFGSCILYLVK